jgi:hypothetical protein
MLVHARMNRAALAVALVTASTGIATAGGYVGLGLGTSPAINVSNEETHRDFVGDGRSARLIGGFRFGRLAVEGAYGGADHGMQLEPNGTYYPISLRQLSVSGKYNLPLSDGFEAYGRLGLQRTSLTLDGDDRFDASGSGVVAGIGMEYRVPIAGASIWIDYQYSHASLENDNGLTKMDLHSRVWTVGATIGF